MPKIENFPQGLQYQIDDVQEESVSLAQYWTNFNKRSSHVYVSPPSNIHPASPLCSPNWWQIYSKFLDPAPKYKVVQRLRGETKGWEQQGTQ